LEHNHEDETILLVVHKTVQKAIHTHLQDQHPHAIKEKDGIGHTAIHVVEHKNDDWTEHIYNDTDHLT
ncbi:MAG: histidine phosphatase family protein, partial [Halobacteriaceae archaeon]